MKTVLIISYYFPPSGGPGVQRVLKFTTYLRSFGWKPVILTVQDADYPARDESLLREIPADVAVYRTRIFEPYAFYRRITGKKAGTPIDVNTIPKHGEKRPFTEQIAEWIRSTFFIPDARMGWRSYAVAKGLEIIQNHDIKALYSSSPPYTCALIARDLKRKTGLPWIAGFRDPWRGFLSTPKRWFLPEMVDRSFERSVFATCDRMEVAWKGILKDFNNKYPDIETDKVHHLPNGFDSADFPHVEIVAKEKFTITYTGSMYGKRNPETFLAAVEQLVQSGKVDPVKIQLQFIGRFGTEVLAMFQNSVLQSSIVVKEYMPHTESVRHLFQSNALLLIVDDFKGNDEIVPGKVFEYIGAGKPILALAPEGAVADVIRETESGEIVRANDIAAIADKFSRFFFAWQKGTLLIKQNHEAVNHYNRREITGQLARLLDDVTSS